ncbi:MAG: hypothetical protein ACLSWS_15300, partial [Faecalispora jeddahensis]
TGPTGADGAIGPTGPTGPVILSKLQKPLKVEENYNIRTIIYAKCRLQGGTWDRKDRRTSEKNRKSGSDPEKTVNTVSRAAI